MLTRIKMKTNLILLFCLWCSFAYSQNNVRTIPIVQYNPTDYLGSIQNSFHSPKDYLDIVSVGNSTAYYVAYDNKRLEMSKAKVFQNKIPENLIVGQDSLFILHLYSNEKYDFKYYGLIKNNEAFLYKSDNREPYSLYDLVVSEFSSIENFRKVLLEDYRNSLESGQNNGLYPLDESTAVKFLKEDYHFYESYNPVDKQRIIQLFTTFLKKQIPVKDYQIEAVKVAMENGNPPLPSEFLSAIWYNPNHKIELFEENYAFIMALNFTEEQYKEIVRSIYAQDQIRKRYVRYLVKEKPEIHYRDGNRIFLSEDEEEKAIAELIFNPQMQ
jgi:hypothetical protein